MNVIRTSAALLLTIIALTAKPLAAQQDAIVGVDQVMLQPLSQTQPVIGRFVALQSGVVSARVPGAVTEMRVDVGDRVKRGEILAVIDLQKMTLLRDAARAEADQAQAEENAARARHNKRQNELTRIEGIQGSAGYSAARHDDAVQNVFESEATAVGAAAAFAGASARLMLAEGNLINARVRAPYNGVVSVRHTEIGSYLQTGDRVLDLVNDTNLEIEVFVPSNRIAGLTPGTVIQVRPADGSSQSATVRGVGAEENATSRTRLVRFTPEFSGATKYGVGESVDALLPLGVPREVVTVHKDAVLKRQGMSLVYVVDSENAAQIRPVELGESVGARFEVLSGLEPGETVVVRGNERLRPGQALRIGSEE
ncbi:MAG TPA: efflux RND transporter periplasmic adaptor subunit [Alphaproteobacteria bacterium]|jgi:RND family efflux transporter MFP subunit|nr:MAG: Multidrug resistance protein MdtE [Alphaproteobacteria bacterium MarineAlpha9_Bin6]PPR36912.1 MAG: Multidrug resistance protein MdtE [Alphaproteobacteria bacterium MarineAlpha9_Bin5]HHZ68473.1 efflux RND transporter periplasmic adaptor subunit [Alphaproteobacteria bacterium]HIA22556.1 efflux RND transporter periplasmic adaptor subunit [Alphaproteobacteria bacterium]HIB55622.1 efflux RND transporter periplasmic adaptor subunit [Alphaproteobacteria bacterium]